MRTSWLTLLLLGCGAGPVRIDAGLYDSLDAGTVRDAGPTPQNDAGSDAGHDSGHLDAGIDSGVIDSGTRFDVTGLWSGTVTATSGTHVVGGTHAVALALVEDGAHVRGVIDVNAQATRLATWVSHLVTGSRQGSLLVLEMTDRLCGAGEPEGLCAPRLSEARSAAFSLEFEQDAAGLRLKRIIRSPGLTYPANAPHELPFDSLSATRTTAPRPSDGGVAGIWEGALTLPRDSIYAGPVLAGRSQVAFLTDQLERWDLFVGGETAWINMWPDDPTLLWGNTFRFDATTQRFWLQQAGPSGPFLWVGQVRGDTIVGAFGSDPIDGGWLSRSPPGDISLFSLTDLEGTFLWERR